MTNDDKTSAGKVQYGMHRTATKISTLSLNKRDKYEYLTGEKNTNPTNAYGNTRA